MLDNYKCDALSITSLYLFTLWNEWLKPATKITVENWHAQQGSYRNLTVVFHDFPGQNYFIFLLFTFYFIFQTFQGILYLFK